MDVFTSAVASEAAKSTVEDAKGAVCWLVREARYCYDFNTYIEDFREDELESTINNVKARVKRANERTEKIGSHVNRGLVKAQAVVQKAEQLDNKVNVKSNCLGRYPNLICRYFLGRQAEKKTLLMKELNGKLGGSKQFSQLKSLRRTDSLEDFFNSKSAELACEQFWEALKNKEIKRIGLYGMGGCGKTTLLNQVAKQAELHFHKVASVVVSNHPNIRNIQGSIASWLNLPFEPEEREPERATRLRMRLSVGEKILIILDDVWEKLEYKAIGIPFGPNNTGCTVLIATRSLDVCISMDCQHNIPLGLLKNDEAWNLFQNHAGKINSSVSAQAREISDKCKGLPIAIVAVASTLKGKTKYDWEMALKTLKDYEKFDIRPGVVDPYRCLQLSYDNLKDDKATRLFLLCSLFPEDSEIQVEDLIRSGIGLDIFEKSDTYEMVRSHAGSIIDKLLRSSMLLRGNEVQSVIMHDVFRSFALSIAKQEIQVVVGSGMDPKARVEDATTKDKIKYVFYHNVDKFPDHLEFPRLEILFIYKDGKCSSQVPDTFFKGMKGLKVLIIMDRSLREISGHLLPESTKLLTNLRTLCLKGCRLDDISFLRNLKRLETLEFSKCAIIKLPHQIADLLKLRLVEVSDCKIQGNPYEVLGRCSYLEELYFLKNDLPEVEAKDHNLVDFFDKEQSSFKKLQRYHVQIGSNIDNIMGKGGKRSKILSICHFEASTTNATIKDLMQRTETLLIKDIHGGCRNIIPDIVQAGGMNELIELLLYESDEIECVIDASKNLGENDTVFSNLDKLNMQNMKSLETLFRGEPPPGLFERLRELQISKCHKMKGILFEGKRKLHSLEVLELKECQSLTSLFSPAVAQSLSLLKVLKITNCNKLKHITAGERSEIVSVFPELKYVSVIECHQLEYLIPVSFAMGLERLESLVIYQARLLKYVFGQPDSSSSNQNLKKKIKLPVLKKLELVDLENVINICSGNHHPSWPSFCQLYLEGSPGLTSGKADTTVVGSESEVRQHGDHSPTKQVRKSCPSWTWRSRLGKQINKKKNAITELQNHSKFEQFSQLAPPPGVTFHSSKPFLHFRSTELVYEELLAALKDDQISMIGLHGIGGCGKTTLVTQACKEAEVRSIFYRVVFVTVSKGFDVQEIQRQIARGLGFKLKEKHKSTWADRLCGRLTVGERILLVLDDLWERLDLEVIGIPFGNKSCCVVLTTRRKQVCTLMNCQRTILVALVSDEESWNLFKMHADINDNSSQTLMGLAHEVAKECKQIPIAIAVVASSLKGKRLLDWMEAVDRLRGSTDAEEGSKDLYPLFLLSYDNLQSEEARSLFLLCSVFPEDYDIHMEILTRYAIGLGLFGESDSYEMTRKHVHEAINKLINSCLLSEPYGGCVKMHDLIRDAALWIAKKQVQVIKGHEMNEKAPGSTIRYLWHDKVNKFPDQLDFRELTFLHIYTDLEDMEVDKALMVMTKLRVLVLHYQQASTYSVPPTLSMPIELLTNLHFLDLDGWELGNLSFLGSLKRLKALRFHWCSFDELPDGILQLTKLRLLDLSECKIKREPYQVIGRCSQLEELYFARCYNSEWKLQGENFAKFFGENSNLSFRDII